MGDWPLVGRDDERRQLRALLTGRPPTGVVLAGDQGVGKTRLAGLIRDELTADGAAVVAVAGGPATRPLPFGALAPLLPATVEPAATSQAALSAAVAALAARAGTDGLLVAVDDAHHLDDASAAVLHQLAADGTVTVLATIRADLPVPDPVRAIWRSGLAERLDLGPLTDDDVTALLRQVLGGDPAPATVAALVDLSAGNPLYLRELVVGSLAQDRLREADGVWLLDAPATTPHLTDVVEDRLRTLSPAARHALELLAVAGALGHRDLVDRVGVEAVDHLEAEALVAVRADRRRQVVTVGHPVHADVVRAALTTATRTARQAEVADLVEGHGARRRDDLLRVAVARLDAGGPVDPDRMTAAAHRALGAYDLGLTERLARVALDAGAGPEAGLALASALARMGRQREADRAFARIDAAGAGDDLATTVALEWADCRFWGLDDHVGATALLTAATAAAARDDDRARLVIAAASYDLLTGRVTEAAATVAPLVEDLGRRATPSAIAAVALVHAPALQLQGRGEAALALLEETVAAYDDATDKPDLVYLGMLVVALCLAAAEVGRLGDARLFAEDGHRETTASGVVLAQAFFALVLGRVAAAEGSLDEAHLWFREAAAGFARAGNRPYEQLCRYSAAGARAQQGAADAARELVAQARAVPVGPVRLQEPLALRAEAAAAVADGDHTTAAQLLADAAQTSRELGLAGEEVGALHDLVRLGRAPSVADRLDELAAVVEGPLLALKARHGRAAADADVAALVAVADGFDELGADLLAAEALAQAASAALVQGDPRTARRCATRSTDLLDGLGPVRTPALEHPVEVAVLSPREREVAVLAARRLASKEIAAELGLSRRTVDNHLQRVYAKLGVNDRRGLAEALDG